MYVPTERTQRKLQQQIHELFCRDDCTGIWGSGEPCQIHSAFMLGQIMPYIFKEMFPAVRENERSKTMDRMRLVPSSRDNCSGGQECGCVADAPDPAYRVVEASRADAVTLS